MNALSSPTATITATTTAPLPTYVQPTFKVTDTLSEWVPEARKPLISGLGPVILGGTCALFALMITIIVFFFGAQIYLTCTRQVGIWDDSIRRLLGLRVARHRHPGNVCIFCHGALYASCTDNSDQSFPMLPIPAGQTASQPTRAQVVVVSGS
jgi:hypothetical protein